MKRDLGRASLDDQPNHSRPSGRRPRWPVARLAIALAAALVLVYSWNVDRGAPTTHAQTLQPVHALPATALANPDPNDDADDTSADGDENAAAPDADGKRVIKRLVPDFKILKGSPKTVIDIRPLFANADTVDKVTSIDIVLNKKKKVVGATIEDSATLVLEPGSVGKTEIIIEARQASGDVIHSKFNVQVWDPDFWKLAMTVVGGLGIFLLGMKSMSDGLQAVAGKRLRRMIGAVTNNRVMATGVGTLVTTVVQSSSITTVMTVGFVSCGLMTLAQAIGVIMGANIGTTITGWILVLKIGKYGLPIAGVAAFGYLFLKRDRARYTSMAVMGLGMVFLGLELMKDGFAIVKELPAFEAWFETFSADTYLGVLKCAAVGCVLTFIVQSSSATLGITIGLAQMGVIPYETAAALVLGENVGTTITAWLASLGATTNAKRAAYFHVLFNMAGVAWITALFPFYIKLIKYIVVGDMDGHVGEEVTGAIAATHTGFNVVNTLMFLPFAGVVARILQRLVPDKKTDSEPKLTNLDMRILESPVIAIEQSHVEIMHMADGCAQMMKQIRQVLANPQTNETIVQRVKDTEQRIDLIQDEIVTFMTNLLSANIPHDLTDEARRQLRMGDEYESVSDYLARILKYQVKLRAEVDNLPPEDPTELLALHDMVAQYLDLVNELARSGEGEKSDEAAPRGQEINQRIREVRRTTLDSMGANGLPPRVSVTLHRQLNGYRRVRDHILNIAEAVTGEK